jgi:SanA protein
MTAPAARSKPTRRNRQPAVVGNAAVPVRGYPRWRRLWRACLVLTALGLMLVAYANFAPSWAAAGRIHDDPAQVPAGRVAMVFGTTDSISGRPNLYFRYRIDAAVRLWESGRIKTIIVSGDNSSKYYNEPARMKTALIARGIPENRIVEDPAGLRTLDSVGRVKEAFQLNEVVFISQRFQNERALYLARGFGLDAHAFNARDVTTHAGLKTRLREVGARVLMWLDVHILGTGPEYFGKHIPLPE